MSKCSKIVIFVMAVLFCCPSVLFALHQVLGGVDLYDPPNGNGIQHSTHVTYWNNIAYVAGEGAFGSSHTAYAIDVSNPNNPQLLSAVGSSGVSKATSGAVAYDKLYVANWTGFLHIYDINSDGSLNPSYTRISDDVPPVLPTAAWGIDVDNQRIYISSADNSKPSTNWRIYILDAAEPYDVISWIQLGDTHTGDLVVRGSYLYYTDGNYFKIANISDENNPYVMTSVFLNQLAGSVVLRDNYAYIPCAAHSFEVDPKTLYIYDISNPLSPVKIGDYGGGGATNIYLLDDYCLMASSILHTIDISDPSSPRAIGNTDLPETNDGCGVAQITRTNSVTGNGMYAYVGASESFPPNSPCRPDNYQRGKLFVVKVLNSDPDNAKPADWSEFSLGEASWDTQYEGDALPGSADPAWQVYEGSEAWASVDGNGILQINDTGTSSGDKIKWWRSWDATNTRGTTVLARAKCDSYDIGGGSIGYLNNIFIEDGKYSEEFAILSDRIRANQANLEYAHDGTQWHTYRITTQGTQFNVYVDEVDTPVLTGPLSTSTQRTRIMFGSGSSAGTQVLHLDFVHFFSNGTHGPLALIPDTTPDISARVTDVAGKGSLSGINPATAKVFWSTDGGGSWSEGGVSVPAICTGQAGDPSGVISADRIPFNQGSYTLNKVRFSIEDMVGNEGFSPIYNVPLGPPGAPSPVTNLTATPGFGRITISWTNPNDLLLDGTMLRFRTDGYPVDPTDGTLLVDLTSEPRVVETFIHENLSPMNTYYYSVFVRDGAFNYAPPSEVSETPDIPGDMDGDQDVDQEDFGQLQACFTGTGAPYSDPECEDADLDYNTFVDQNDFAVFAQCMNGANNPPGC